VTFVTGSRDKQKPSATPRSRGLRRLAACVGSANRGSKASSRPAGANRSVVAGKKGSLRPMLDRRLKVMQPAIWADYAGRGASISRRRLLPKRGKVVDLGAAP